MCYAATGAYGDSVAPQSEPITCWGVKDGSYNKGWCKTQSQSAAYPITYTLTDADNEVRFSR